ncbi:MAG: glutamate racemase [Candidatus Kerfeldbacteria bacterium]|nr:glutamate racemase [Candidatus Kerfeldbacteria bacterium]
MIGIFDSGVGGLTVAREVLRQLPGVQIVYFGDTARAPYGPKGPDVIRRYADEDIALLTKVGATVVIAACNTVSAVTYDALQQKHVVPVFEVVTPAIEEALRVSQTKRIGVIGTRATVDSGVYPRVLTQRDRDVAVHQRACPLLVALVEEDWLRRPETTRIVRTYLTPLKRQDVDTLILGCTHYPFLRDTIQAKMSRRVTLVDPAAATTVRVKAFLAEHPDVDQRVTRGSAHRFLFSDVNPHVQEIANRWLAKKVRLEQANAG